MKYSVMKDSVMKFSVPISSLSSRGLKNLIFSFYNKCELLSKAINGNFFVSKDFCDSIGDGVFKEQLLDKIILQQEKAQAKEQGETQEADKSALLGIRIENRTDDYDGDLVFTGFNQSEEQEAVQEETAQEDTGQEKTVQEDAVQEANKPNFDPAFDNIPTVGTETAANFDANNNAVDAVEVAFTLETPLVTLRDRAISAFLDYLVNHCNDVKHVALEAEEARAEATKNEKFAMRAWFTQLGWRGKEDNVLRSYFYDNLEGNTAFRTEEDHARWAARWQPRYFDKHPEMKWVLEEQREQGEQSEPESSEPESDQHMAEEVGEYIAASNLIEPDETVAGAADSAGAAEVAEVAEAVSDTALATVGTEKSAEVVEEVEQESAKEAPQEAVETPVKKPVERSEAIENATKAVAEAEAEAKVEVATAEEIRVVE